MNEIDLRSYLLPKHRSVFSALRNLGVSIGCDHWCLVGGLMVLVVGAAHGAAGRRSEGTKDGDVVVDIVVDPHMLERVIATLRSHGFDIADAVGGSGEWAGGDTARGVTDRAWVSAVVAVEKYRVEHDIADRRAAIGPEPSGYQVSCEWYAVHEKIAAAQELIAPPVRAVQHRAIEPPSLGIDLGM